MNWREFFASLVGSLAWPAAIAFIVYLLRDALRRRIQALRRLRHRDMELEFGDQVEEAEAVAQQAELPPAEATVSEPALSTELGAMIDAAPRAAVIEAWLAVEQELQALAEQAGIGTDDRRPMPLGRVADELLARGVIDRSLASVLRQLRQARDAAAHSHPYKVESDEVRDYVKLAGRVRAALRLAGQALEAATEGETTYDLLVYHDMTDPTPSTGGAVPSVGDPAERWFGTLGRNRHVVAVGPGIHEGRITVVLAHGRRPMPEVQALLDRAAEH